MHDWKYSQEKALAKALYRNIHIARTSPEYRIQHPNEARLNPSQKVLKLPSPEAEKRIKHDYVIRIRNSFQPKVIRPKRLNKIV